MEKVTKKNNELQRQIKRLEDRIIFLLEYNRTTNIVTNSGKTTYELLKIEMKSKTDDLLYQANSIDEEHKHGGTKHGLFSKK